MNNLENEEDLLLGQYINPEKREKAPKGFTSRVMMHVQEEKIPRKSYSSLREKWMVPAISSITALVLVVAAVLSPTADANSFTFTVLNMIKKLKISLPEVDFMSLLKVNLQSPLIYVFIGFCKCLTLLRDRALYGVFHKGNEVDKN